MALQECCLFIFYSFLLVKKTKRAATLKKGEYIHIQYINCTHTQKMYWGTNSIWIRAQQRGLHSKRLGEYRRAKSELLSVALHWGVQYLRWQHPLRAKPPDLEGVWDRVWMKLEERRRRGKIGQELKERKYRSEQRIRNTSEWELYVKGKVGEIA